MSKNFITNKDKKLSELISDVMPDIISADFLVWFFYFSWFQEIYKELKDINIRVLVWMEVEQWIKKSIHEYTSDKEIKRKEVKSKFIEQMKLLFDKTTYFDNAHSQEAIDLFIEKIKNKTLVIKKTKDPNHAKLYLMEKSKERSEWGSYPWVTIIWSSNFTFQWLTNRNEFNYISRQADDFISAKEFFQQLREDSLPITDGWEDDLLVKMILEQTHIKLSHPYLFYIRILKEYFDVFYQSIKTPKEITNNSMMNLTYQVDAVKEALSKLSQHNGVIIADVVWLGKSIIWSTIVANLQSKAIVIAPPHLIPQREDYGKKFWLSLDIYWPWSIHKALLDDREYNTHNIVMVDEAHRFINAQNKDYWYLHQLCQGKKIILLTATPYNNKPEDIFNLIKLFQIPKASTLHTEQLLSQEFSELEREYKKIYDADKKATEQNDHKQREETKHKAKELSQRIKHLISPVVIRRSRIDLEKRNMYRLDLEKQWIQYSTVKKPHTQYFQLWVLEQQYWQTIEDLLDLWTTIKEKKFSCARYTPLLYLDEKLLVEGTKYYDTFMGLYGYSINRVASRQTNMPLFITRLVVSRFESSLSAFQITLKNIILSYEAYEKRIKKWYIPVIGKGTLPTVEDIDEMEIKEIMNEWLIIQWDEDETLLNQKLIQYDGFVVKLSDLSDEFQDNFYKDLDFLKQLQSERSDIEQDPKLVWFVETLQQSLLQDPIRKIVVFSQYADTINELYHHIEKVWLRVMKVVWWIKSEKEKDTLKLNFDAWVDKAKQRDDYDIVVATDSISEWYNLHRAGTIYNYDIPYNPTRITQRVGRINRINKKVFDELYINNFFPSSTGESIIGIERISKIKIHMINSIFWADTKLLDENETLESYYEHILQEDEWDSTELSWEVEYQNLLDDIQNNHPQVYDEVCKLPLRSKVRRDHSDHKDKIVMFGKKWRVLVYKMINKHTKETSTINIEELIHMFKADLTEKALPVSESFYPLYHELESSLFVIQKDGIIDNAATIKALDKVKQNRVHFGNEYVELLEYVINKLDGLPDVYLEMIRDISPTNYLSQIAKIKNTVSLEYLQLMKDIAEWKTKEEELLIFSEEF